MLDLQDIRVTSYLPHSGHGAGGMMVGLTTSGIIVHHIPTGLGVSCDSERSQHANKEKALKLLETLVKPVVDWEAVQKYYAEQQGLITQEARVPFYEPSTYREPNSREPNRTMLHKVSMIKDVRQAAGCGLKEAKEAVDSVYASCWEYDEVIRKAVATFKRDDYSCSKGDWCVCGGDTQGVRQGCGWYTGVQIK